jgi:hypothetical protein
VTDGPDPDQPAPGDESDRAWSRPPPEPPEPPQSDPPPPEPPPSEQPPGEPPSPGYPAEGYPPQGYPPGGVPPGGFPPGAYQPPGSYQPPGGYPPGYERPAGFPSMPPPPGGSIPNSQPGANRFGVGLGDRANILGVLSAVAGFLSVVCCVCASFGGGGVFFSTLVLSIPAIVLGILHLRRIRAGQATNKSLAIIGIVLGAIGLLIAICAGSTSIGTNVNNDVH